MKSWNILFQLLLFCLFLGATGCDYGTGATFILVEYGFEKCPDRNFELPERLDFNGWELNADQDALYCHGYIHYSMTELTDSGALGRSLKSKHAPIYAKLNFGKSCTLHVAIPQPCLTPDSPSKCEKENVTLSEKSQELTAAFAATILGKHPLKLKPDPVAVTPLGGMDDLKKWCSL